MYTVPIRNSCVYATWPWIRNRTMDRARRTVHGALAVPAGHYTGSCITSPVACGSADLKLDFRSVQRLSADVVSSHIACQRVVARTPYNSA